PLAVGHGVSRYTVGYGKPFQKNREKFSRLENFDFDFVRTLAQVGIIRRHRKKYSLRGPTTLCAECELLWAGENSLLVSETVNLFPQPSLIKDNCFVSALHKNML